jgi:hypothetical protein
MKLFVLLIPVFLFACGNTKTENMAYYDINRFKVDCGHPAEQMTFLKAQLRNANDGPSRAVISQAIREIKDWCPPPGQRPQGCITARETFTSGTGYATVCHMDQREGPVINRWEAEVDN